MVVDFLHNWTRHFSGPVWQCAFQFLESLTPDCEDGEVQLDGTNVFARIMSYPTIPRESAVLEAHRKYIDIQSTISGAEGIEWFPIRNLQSKTSYDEEKDVEFFIHPAQADVRVDNRPGMFVVLHPTDAHMPQLVVDEKSETIRKVVVKVRADLV